MSSESPRLEAHETEHEHNEREAFLERSRSILKQIAETAEDTETPPSQLT